MDHASLGSHIDFERLMNLSRVKPAILSSKRVLVVKPLTVVLIRVGYFVLLNYSYKSWSIIKTRDIFENCWS